VLAGYLGEPTTAVFSDRAHLQPHAAFVQGGEHVTRYGLLYNIRVGEHCQEEVRAACGVGRAIGDLGAVFFQGLGLLARAVPGAYLYALGEEVARHRGAHDPGPQHRHLRAVSHLPSCPWIIRTYHTPPRHKHGVMSTTTGQHG
jgi:hypothetical protein